MSIEAMFHVLNAPLGGTPKVVLLGLANHAGADFANARPSVATLAQYAHCDRRTVQRTLRKLEEDGWIVKTGEHPVAGRPDRSVAVWRIARGQNAAPSDGATLEAERGGTGDANGAAPMPPEPSIQPSIEPSGTDLVSAGGGQASLLPQDPPATDPAARLVALWAQITPGREKAKQTPKRLQVIRARLRSFPEDAVERAIREAALSDFHNGQNDRNTVYNDLTTTLRDDEKLEAWLLKADRRAAGIAPTEGYRNGSSRSAAVDANMDLLDSLSSPDPADRWE